MAVNESSGFLRYKDSEGNTNLLFPITTKDNVDGIDEIETELAETVKFTAQALDDNQKAQVRTNIGAISSEDVENTIANMDLTVADAVTIDINNTNIGDPNTINANSLNGKTEEMLSVLRAVEAENAENALHADSAENALHADSATHADTATNAVNANNSDNLEGHSVNSLIDKIYPIGSIYMSVNSASPATLFGGTWERIQDRFILAAGSTYAAGSTGGEATHTLTVDEMPKHNHGTWFEISSAASSMYLASGSNCGDTTRQTANTGGGKPHNNMPPYLAVYMWKRTA